MMTPFAPEMTPKKSPDGNYHGCIYFDPNRDPYVATQEKVAALSEKLKTAVQPGDVIVPVRVYEWRDNEVVWWHKSKEERVLVRDYFPKWLPLRMLLAGREDGIIEVTIDPLNKYQSVTYSLLCTQSSHHEGARFETWYQDAGRAKVFNYSQYFVDYLNRTVPTISRSVARPIFEEEQIDRGPKISLKPLVEAELAKGNKDFKIRVNEDDEYEDMSVDPEALKKYSAFFRKPLNSKAMTQNVDEGAIFEFNGSIPLMRELVYYLNNDCLNPEITMNTCLGLIGLNSNFGKEKQNLSFEKECLEFIQARLSRDNCEKVIRYAERNAHPKLLALVEAFLKRENLNLVGLGIYTVKDCVELYQTRRSIAELIAIGIREELILHGNPKLWKQVFETAREYRLNHMLFDELCSVCEHLARRNPNVKGANE